MVDVITYAFKLLTQKIVKPEENFINAYFNEYLKYEGSISSTRRMRRIMDAKYKNAYLNKVMAKQCQHLSIKEPEKLLKHPLKFEYLFDGKLGTWKTTPVDLELKDDTKPVCSRPYPVPRVHTTMFKKEVERIVKLGVLEEANDPEWGSPSFAQQKQKRIGYNS